MSIRRFSALGTIATAAAALLLATELPLTAAKLEYVARIPNGANVPDVPAVGHADPEGLTKDVNAFGEAFHKAGKKWTVALCQADSDGDGQTNGQELGDPCCEWTPTSPNVRWTTGVSDPGVKSKTTSATLLASVMCPGTEAAVATASVVSSPKTPTSNSASSTATSSPIDSGNLTATKVPSMNTSNSSSSTPAATKAASTTEPSASATSSASDPRALALSSLIALAAIGAIAVDAF